MMGYSIGVYTGYQREPQNNGTYEELGLFDLIDFILPSNL